MRTPRTPRDPLPKIGEGPDSAESDGGDETPQRKHEEEWESLELDDSALQDSPAKAGDATAAPAPENAPGEGAPTASADAQEQAAETRASSEAAEGEDAASPGAADAAHDGASVGQGPTDAAADNGMTGAAEAEEAGGGGSGGSAAPEQDADESTASKEQAMPERIKTLKDYVEGRPSRSPRGVNLEQVKASPKGEDLTKIQFARFSFNGVDTTLLDRQTKKVNNGSVEGSEGAQVLEGTDLQSLIDKGLFKEAGGAEDAASGTSFAGSERRRRSPSPRSLPKGPALDVLSTECIARVGVGAVGQEYTSMLKSLGKRLDLALREGLDAGDRAIGADIQESQHVARLRWEAVQRLSAILHEVHDAEVGLSLAEAKQQVSRERELWQEESALLASQHDALLKRAHDELEVAERRVCSDFSEELLQKLTDTTQNWSNASFERQIALISLFESDVLRNEEDILRQYSSAKALRNMKVSAQVSSAIHNTLGDGSQAPLSTFLQPPHAQFMRSASETLLSEGRDGKERGSSPASVLSRNSVRAAYEQGNGSLPIQFWDEDTPHSPRSVSRSHQAIETKASTSAPPAEYNFIPDTLVSDSAGRAAQSFEAASQQRRGFGPTGALAALASRAGTTNGGQQQRGRSTGSPMRFLF